MEQIKSFKILAKIAVKRTTVYLLEDEKGGFLCKEKTIVLSAVREKKILLTNAKPMGQGIQVLGEEKIPTLSEEQYLGCRNDHEKLRTILAEKSITRPSIRKVVAIIQEKGSHISGYRLDDMEKGEIIDIYRGKEQDYWARFQGYQYENAVIGENGSFQVLNEGDLPYEEGVSPKLQKTRDDKDRKWVICELLGEEYMSYPEQFYHYESCVLIDQGKRKEGWNGSLTQEGKLWLQVMGDSGVMPKPLHYIDGLPVIKWNKVLKYCEFPCHMDLSLFDDGTFSLDDALRESNSLVSLVLPLSLTTIGEYAFYSCTSLQYIQIPPSVTAIGSNAFKDCIRLTTVALPDTLISIAPYTFENCQSLTQITLPKSAKYIEEHAFSGCSKLRDITFSGSLSSIGESGFRSCTSLTTLDLQTPLEAIGECAFADCSGLLSLRFPDKLRRIGEWAFYGCSRLTEVALPKSIIYMGDGAFDEGVSLSFK